MGVAKKGLDAAAAVWNEMEWGGESGEETREEEEETRVPSRPDMTDGLALHSLTEAQPQITTHGRVGPAK